MSDLFVQEEEILNQAKADAATMNNEKFTELADAYGRLLKQLKLTTKISDKTFIKTKELEELRVKAKEQEFELKLHEEQIKTVLAMAVTANHEINQHLHVLSLAFDIIKVKQDFENMSEKDLKHWDKIENAIKSIADLLVKYTTQHKNISFQKYLEKDQMVTFGDS